MYQIDYTNQFQRSLKKCVKRGLDIEKLRTAIKILAEQGTLSANYKPHILSGNMDGIWECHIQSDWLLTWSQDDTILHLLMLDTGTHSDLFGKNRK